MEEIKRSFCIQNLMLLCHLFSTAVGVPTAPKTAEVVSQKILFSKANDTLLIDPTLLSEF
jgi:hypothetical protein